MVFKADEVYEFVRQEEIESIRLAFCDVYGRQKNISIFPDELKRAFTDGISFDASAICGFGAEVKSDLLLFPIPSTLTVLPWCNSHGKVVRMFCDIKYPDGRNFERDSRLILGNAVKTAEQAGITVQFGAEFEFYLFKTDADGAPTGEPFDNAGYMDIPPEDGGENVRREICMTLIDMNIKPESSHHEEGPGQNEIDFRYGDAVTAADNAMNFITVVKTIAQRNGLYADFSPKPLINESGNGMHINMSVKSRDNKDYTGSFMAGILSHIKEMTVFLNPTKDSYKRLGEKKAPRFITWSPENRSQLIRIPAARGEYRRIELRSPDPTANPYLAYALLIYAGLDGIQKNLTVPKEVNMNLYTADKSATRGLEALPLTLDEALERAAESEFIRGVLGTDVYDFLGL